jgi:hypothetical protein
MQRTIHKHGVDFEVEFTEAGEVDAIYIGAVEVSEVIRESTERAIISEVMMYSADWFAEYRREMANEMRRAA